MRSTVVARAHQRSSHMSPTVICAIVSAVIAAMAILTVIFARFTRRRQKRQDEEAARPASPPMSAEKQKKQKLFDHGRIEQEELQRQIMIRKSLASRTSWRSASPISQANDDEMDGQDRPTDIRSDWKQWEAGIRHKHSISNEMHPCIDPGLNPASHLTAPVLSRSASPARHPLLASISKSPSLSPSPSPSPSPSRLPSISGQSAIEGLGDLQALKRSIQQQILRKNSEGSS